MSEIMRMKALVALLSKASKAYYQENREIMSNLEYDQLYDELVALEEKNGLVLQGSPTNQVGYEIVSKLPKEAHNSTMLSLDKTKSRDDLLNWLGDKKGLLSWKLDGLTLVLTYEDGILAKGVTRGNGIVGEVITNNVRVFDNVPHKINHKGTLVLRGEAVIKYSDFENINALLSEEEQYKNPRNLCSGTVRQLNNAITASRHVNFFAFQLVSGEGLKWDAKSEQLNWLGTLGFDVVPFKEVDRHNLLTQLDIFEKEIMGNDFASDGLVLTFDSKAYSESLGVTSKFPKHSIAFKWQDEIKETQLKSVEWRASRTGLINPIALFDPVELEGTTVSRASLHNVSILKQLELGVGDIIEVYKANMIIPQVAGNQTRSNTLEIPGECPICKHQTEIKKVQDVEVLYCNNMACGAKKIKALAHFVSRDAMNIDGLSEAGIEKFVEMDLIHELADLYRLEQHKDIIINSEGYGEKSFENLIAAIHTSKKVKLENLIYALGIPGVGLSNARLLSKYFDHNFEKIKEADIETLANIEGFGEIIAKSLYDFFHNPSYVKTIKALENYIEIEKPEENTVEQILKDKTFVITGNLETYANRNALKDEIETLGGKVTGSVTGKTTYLINNDVTSTSGKNKKAKELGVSIINEQDYKKLIDNQ
ncbi:NAD-dependent DNA ligase LigA [Petrocella sp. FN5]|uniref:NAD-dependent DNA ligase LigA n=1 Tax=Petrocella sp. FN5 TaxID=3032002 RepID=UPI0023D99F9B|nr:NAD-dependent DNA ligase LigA [Petrocella sp. FN5]MDF1616559.1 NAD-dependent DNA ligase LigA [Petrocella sp. FN5]